MYKRYPDRLRVIDHYLKSGDTLTQTADKFNVHYQSVYKWLKIYRKSGAEGLTNTYKRPWNRVPRSLEEDIANLKEKDPAITVRKIQAELQARSINMSLKGIWQTLVRYGYAGYDKKRLSPDFNESYAVTSEMQNRYAQAELFFKRGDLRKAADILNSMPILPYNELLPKIPESLCNLPRRVERSCILFGKTPLPIFLKKIRALYDECENKDLHILALKAGIAEIIGLSWGIHADRQLERTQELRAKFRVNNGYCSYNLFVPMIILMISEGISRAHRSEIDQANKIARQCRRKLKRRSVLSSELMVLIGTLYNQLEDCHEAGKWFEQALDTAPDDTIGSIRMRLAEIYFLKGLYDEALRLVRKGSTKGWIHKTRGYFYKAMRSFMRGMPYRSIQMASEALSIARKEGLNWGFLKAYNAIASAYLSLGETGKARYAVRRLMAYSKKLKRAETAFEILLSKDKIKSSAKISRDVLPSTRLAILLKQGQYMRAYRLARQKGMMAYLHRFIFYVPDAVRKILASGKSSGLPKSILNLPIFNQEGLVCNIRFMGDLVLYRNHRYIRHRLPPKDKAFLIHLAIRLSEPHSRISVSEICRNFWKNTKNPEQNIYHALMRVKSTLKLPAHMIQIKTRDRGSMIINKGIYFINDFAEAEQVLTTAEAFARAGEWKFSRDDLISAFKLLRGEPFRKMYDPWSEDMRHVMINKFEKSLTNFMNNCPDRDSIEKVMKYREKLDAVFFK